MVSHVAVYCFNFSYNADIIRLAMSVMQSVSYTWHTHILNPMLLIYPHIFLDTCI